MTTISRNLVQALHRALEQWDVAGELEPEKNRLPDGRTQDGIAIEAVDGAIDALERAARAERGGRGPDGIDLGSAIAVQVAQRRWRRSCDHRTTSRRRTTTVTPRSRI